MSIIGKFVLDYGIEPYTHKTVANTGKLDARYILMKVSNNHSAATYTINLKYISLYFLGISNIS